MINKNEINIILNNAINNINNHNLSDANNICDNILIDYPKNIQALQIKAVIYSMNNDAENALMIYNKILKIDPINSLAYFNRGILYATIKDYKSSNFDFEKTILLDRNNISAYVLLGNNLRELGDKISAKKYYLEVVNKNNKSFEGYVNLGIIQFELDEINESIISFKNAIYINPNSLITYCYLSNSLIAINSYDEAIKILHNSIDKDKSFVDNYYYLGNVYLKMNYFDDAIFNYSKAIELNFKYVEAYINLSNIYKKIHDYTLCIYVLKKALSIDPCNIQIIIQLGNINVEKAEYNEAIIYYKKALIINDKNDIVHYNLATTYFALDKYEDSIKHFNIVLSLNINELAISDLLYLLLKCGEWDQINTLTEKLEFNIKNNKIQSIFPIFCLFDNPYYHYKVAIEYSRNKYPLIHNKNQIEKKKINYCNNKIKLAYFSADFKDHPVSHLISEVIEKHDRSKFEVIAFSFTKNISSKYSKYIISLFDKFFDVSNKNDFEIIECCINNKIDIAVNLGGYTYENRPSIFSHRIANVQVNYLGFPATMGSPYYDYIIADNIVIPDSNMSFFTEKICYLPSCYLPYNTKLNINKLNFSKSELKINEDTFVFGCLNSSYKITPFIFNCWIEILKNTQNSILLLADNNYLFTSNILNKIKDNKITSDRIIFLPRVEKIEDHLARINIIDLYLDTYPYNGHTSSMDALWAEVPVITIKGNSFPSRVTASILNTIELKSLITLNKNEYVSKAIELCHNKTIINEYKEKIKSNKVDLFNTKNYVNSLEKAYTIMSDFNKKINKDNIYL